MDGGPVFPTDQLLLGFSPELAPQAAQLAIEALPELHILEEGWGARGCSSRQRSRWGAPGLSLLRRYLSPHSPRSCSSVGNLAHRYRHTLAIPLTPPDLAAKGSAQGGGGAMTQLWFTGTSSALGWLAFSLPLPDSRWGRITGGKVRSDARRNNSG